MQAEAECRGGQKEVCRGDACGGVVNRESDGVAACLSLLREDATCGDKWFEVGNNKCYCYPVGLEECDIMSDGGEDLYQIGEIGEIIWKILYSPRQ